MTKIRVFPHNEKGKIEFTKEELQKLLNEVYNEGKTDSYTIYYGTDWNIRTVPCNTTSAITNTVSAKDTNVGTISDLTADKITVTPSTIEVKY